MTNDMTACNWWLMKSEPEAYSIDQLRKERTTIWDGIRNYQARNFMRSMKAGDQVFFYHSNCKSPSIVGLMEVINRGIVDPTQFDPSSKYFDPKSKKENPRWDCTEMKYICTFKNTLSLEDIKQIYHDSDLKLIRKGNRLSIMPIEESIAKDILNRVGV